MLTLKHVIDIEYWLEDSQGKVYVEFRFISCQEEEIAISGALVPVIILNSRLLMGQLEWKSKIRIVPRDGTLPLVPSVFSKVVIFF